MQVVLLNSSRDNDGNYVLMRLEFNLWVSLMLGKIGGHTKDAAKHSGAAIGGPYKTKVLGFRVSSSM